MKIGNELLGLVAAAYGFHTLGHLLSDGYPGPVSLRRVARVVAVGASSHGYLPITIGTGKVRSDTYLMDPQMKVLFENSVEGVVANATPLFV